MGGDPTRGASSTKMARFVRATAAGAQPGATAHPEAHRRTNWLRDVILGGQDGLVNILGIILGVVAAGGSRTVQSPWMRLPVAPSPNTSTPI